MSFDFWVGPFSDPDRIRLGPAVASGAEGVLYRATAELSNGSAQLAVKMLQPGHLGRLREWTTRWREQVELLRQARVPGLVVVRGGFVGPLPHQQGNADTSTASLYLLMDWVEGVSLDRWVRALEAPVAEQLLLALVPVAAALDLLHSGAATGGVPVVHRDVKPANILVRPEGPTVLVDVGNARGLVDGDARSGVVGTPGYIAPEVQAEGRYSPASDRYSLGAVVFFLFTGSEPSPGATAEQLAEALEGAPAVGGRVEVVEHVLAMLDRDTDRRPAPLANWVAQLRRSSLSVLPGETRLAPPAPRRNPSRPAGGTRRRRSNHPGARARVGIGLSLVLVLVALGLRLWQDPGPQHSASARPPAVDRPDTSVLQPSSTVDAATSETTVVSASAVDPSAPQTTSVPTTKAPAIATTPTVQQPFRPRNQWDHIRLQDTVVQLGQELSPGALALLDGSGSTADPYRYRDDHGVSIVVLGRQVALIMLATPRDGYLDLPGLYSGMSTGYLRSKVPNLSEGQFGSAPALVASSNGNATYFVLDYDDTTGPCPTVDRISVIALISSGTTPQIAPNYAYARCSSRA